MPAVAGECCAPGVGGRIARPWGGGRVSCPWGGGGVLSLGWRADSPCRPGEAPRNQPRRGLRSDRSREKRGRPGAGDCHWIRLRSWSPRRIRSPRRTRICPHSLSGLSCPRSARPRPWPVPGGGRRLPPVLPRTGLPALVAGQPMAETPQAEMPVAGMPATGMPVVQMRARRGASWRPVGSPAGRRPRHPDSPSRERIVLRGGPRADRQFACPARAVRPSGPPGSSLALTVTGKGRYPSWTSMCVRMPAVPAQRGWLRGSERVGLPHLG